MPGKERIKVYFERKSRKSTREYIYAHSRESAVRQRSIIQRCPVFGKASGPRISARRRNSEELDPDYVEAVPGGNRETYMGSTPTKSSSVGKKVIQNMLEQEIKDDGTWLSKDAAGKVYLQTIYAPGQVFYIDSPVLHMGHLYDAVTFWNEIGRYTGAKSGCVLAFMHDANNYLIQYGPRNCQMAPHEGYLPPADRLWEDFTYIPCSFVGDKTNFGTMKTMLLENGYI